VQELKNLRPQLYSASEYCEKSYLHSEQKHVWDFFVSSSLTRFRLLVLVGFLSTRALNFRGSNSLCMCSNPCLLDGVPSSPCSNWILCLAASILVGVAWCAILGFYEALISSVMYASISASIYPWTHSTRQIKANWLRKYTPGVEA
jgi:hypothetical protein